MPIEGDVEALVRRALAEPASEPAFTWGIDLTHAKPAAVVVPLLPSPLRALLVVRGKELRDHAGEVGFPGGKPEPGDASLEATALRELEEEVGLARESVAIAGTLAPVPVITGRYLIHPFVGLVDPKATARVASTGEIQRLVELPIDRLFDEPFAISAVRRTVLGRTKLIPFFPLDDCVLYGASAYIFWELLSRLAAVLGRTIPEPRMVEGNPWGNRYG